MTPKASFSPWRPHPWHGLPAGAEPPRRLNAFIELTPHDLVKYELDKDSGYLRVDRPQRTSAQPPSLYGFVPRTYCGPRVARLMGTERGDGDPLDICVLCERPVARVEVLMEVRVVGGLPVVDAGEADDKLIAVLETDGVWGQVEDIGGVPRALLDRLIHYFATYEFLPDSGGRAQLGEPYGRDHAEEVVRAALADYAEHFGSVQPEVPSLVRG